MGNSQQTWRIRIGAIPAVKYTPSYRHWLAPSLGRRPSRGRKVLGRGLDDFAGAGCGPTAVGSASATGTGGTGGGRPALRGALGGALLRRPLRGTLPLRLRPGRSSGTGRSRACGGLPGGRSGSGRGALLVPLGEGAGKQLEELGGSLVRHRDAGVDGNGGLPGAGVADNGRGEVEDEGPVGAVEDDMVGENRRHRIVFDVELLFSCFDHRLAGFGNELHPVS